MSNLESVLSWGNQNTHDHGHIECNGSRIVYTPPVAPGKRIHVLTSQPIPQVCTSFNFETEVITGVDTNDIHIGIANIYLLGAIGIDGSDSSLFYNGLNGEIMTKEEGKEEETVAFTTPLKRRTVIGCHIKKISTDKGIYTLCQFTKAGKGLGPIRMLNGNRLYPYISFNSSQADVDTKFGIASNVLGIIVRIDSK